MKPFGRVHIKRWIGVFAALLAIDLRGAARDIAAPVAPPYAADRKLAVVDTVEITWHDAARNRDVPAKIYFPRDVAGKLPVIVFSHGLGGTREGYEYLGRQWAANSYISVHIQHAGSDASVWRDNPHPALAVVLAASFQNAVDRGLDVHFAIDQLANIEDDKPALKGRLDMTRIGVAGHSFGAQTALLSAGEHLGGTQLQMPVLNTLADARVVAVIAMSEPVLSITKENLDASYGKIGIPTFFMTGTKDDSPLRETMAPNRRLAYDHTAATPSLLLTLTGGDHFVFSGRSRGGRPLDPPQQKLVRIASTAFWDAYLKNDSTAKDWLLGDEFTQLINDQATFEHK
jgi:fermentation-respiration switch protein FrsA (DUF1100 family)